MSANTRYNKIMPEYSCKRCHPYKKHKKIYFVRELKELVCDEHVEAAWKDAAKKKK